MNKRALVIGCRLPEGMLCRCLAKPLAKRLSMAQASNTKHEGAVYGRSIQPLDSKSRHGVAAQVADPCSVLGFQQNIALAKHPTTYSNILSGRLDFGSSLVLPRQDQARKHQKHRRMSN